MRGGWALLAAALAAACAETAPTIRRGGAPPTEDGIVVGRLGVPASALPNANGRDMKIEHVATGKVWAISFDESASTDDGRTAPFFAALPAGRYRIRSFEVIGTAGGRGMDEGTGVVFEVVPGRARCLGALYAMQLSGALRGAGRGFAHAGMLVPRDECDELEKLLRARVPALLHRWEIALAVNEACPPCRAELEPFRPPVYGRPGDLSDVPVFTAEAQRLPGPPVAPVRWPEGLTTASRSLLLRVCTAPDGSVREVKVLESVHPDVDAQLVAAARTWRFRPFDIDGQPHGFCYRPRFEHFPRSP